ncbi:lipoprotein-releasing system permease protein [Niabella drilacis]|uniref:Lipoprotein-releasing system permease protein n=1 Tax=Niabella drilacis (strain DSM 25811 / CCM 8410 / CCUG 62505 / LMG 26954 / E90) TaxID=1285928 RepID=A0A1G6MYF0_NIADE|nr:lipoprotein-releasing system permease protein [Niabella drilacis]
MINIIAWICIVAIMIGTAALILVLSVFNGFEGLVKSLYSSFYPDIKVIPASGKYLVLTETQLQQLRGVSGLRNFSLVVEEKAILRNGDNQALVSLKGVDARFKAINGIAEHMVNGRFDIGTAEHPRLVVGGGIEGSLSIRTSPNVEPMSIYIPRKSESEAFDAASNITPDTIRSAGTFVIQQDFDNKYAITEISFLKQAMGLDARTFSGIEIAVTDPSVTAKVQQSLQQLFGKGYTVQDRYQQNQSLYAIMNLERWVFYAILSLILVVAAFNMVGALTMLVLEKQKDISVLNALGADRGFILKVFLSEGFLLAMIGGGMGMLLALAMVLLQKQFHLVPLQGGSFLIDYFPVALKLRDFLLVAITVLIIAFVASWTPARKASRKEFSLKAE